MQNEKNKSPQSLSTSKNGGLSSSEVEAVMLSEAGENAEMRLLAEIEATEGSSTVIVPEKIIITDFEKLPKSFVFSEDTEYKLLNRETKRSFIINGKQVEARVGIDYGLREKLESRTVKVFCIDNNVIAFHRALISPSKN